jgi:septum formation protein
VPEVDETARPGERPDALAERLAAAKACAVARAHPDAIVIGCDQVAIRNGQALGKPGSAGEAEAQLAASSGEEVSFYTAACVIDASDGRRLEHTDVTRVQFRELTNAEIRRYVERERPLDCAASFKVEGLGISLFERVVSEDPTALIGLPMIFVCRALNQFGVSVP